MSKHRPVKGQWHTYCEACHRAIMFTGGYWVIIDSGSPTCLGEYEGGR